jgi:hypothetical protein
MVNREKRLQKGIESIERQIELHKLKQKQAEEQGNIELMDYYEKEISGLEKSKYNKEDKL